MMVGAATADEGLLDPPHELGLVERLKRGERAALGELYAAYGDRLYRAVILPRLPIRELAEDVLRDTFRLALERIHQYTPADRSVFFWMRRIAINRAMDVHRAHKRQEALREKAEQDPERVMGVPPPRPDRGQELIETRELIEESLAQINPRYAQALRLRLLDDKDREECAALMEVTVATFDVILHRACKAFREKYPPR